MDLQSKIKHPSSTPTDILMNIFPSTLKNTFSCSHIMQPFEKKNYPYIIGTFSKKGHWEKRKLVITQNKGNGTSEGVWWSLWKFRWKQKATNRNGEVLRPKGGESLLIQISFSCVGSFWTRNCVKVQEYGDLRVECYKIYFVCFQFGLCGR